MAKLKKTLVVSLMIVITAVACTACSWKDSSELKKLSALLAGLSADRYEMQYSFTQVYNGFTVYSELAGVRYEQGGLIYRQTIISLNEGFSTDGQFNRTETAIHYQAGMIKIPELNLKIKHFSEYTFTESSFYGIVNNKYHDIYLAFEVENLQITVDYGNERIYVIELFYKINNSIFAERIEFFYS